MSPHSTRWLHEASSKTHLNIEQLEQEMRTVTMNKHEYGLGLLGGPKVGLEIEALLIYQMRLYSARAQVVRRRHDIVRRARHATANCGQLISRLDYGSCIINLAGRLLDTGRQNRSRRHICKGARKRTSFDFDTSVLDLQ